MVEKLWGKIGIITFMILIVFGFTVPSVLNSNSATAPKSVELRLCQTDSDCYLSCESGPVAVLCTQNLCQQNGCEEAILYPFQQTPVVFQLHVDVGNGQLLLQNKSNKGNFFVAVEGNTLKVYSSGLSLNHILDKLGMMLTDQCLVVDGSQYCNTSPHALHVMINGNESFTMGRYIPEENDNIVIWYS